MNLPQNWVTV